MATILSTNLRKERNRLNLTQSKAAQRIGIPLRNLQAYEEGRAEPPVRVVLNIAEAYNITDITGFLTNPQYNPNQRSKTQPTRLEKAYSKLQGKEKTIVDVLLGFQ